METSYHEGSGFYYAIEEDGVPVGQCSVQPRPDGSAEVGYWVRTDRTGRGLATRAVMAVAEAALADGQTRLVIHCDEGTDGAGDDMDPRSCRGGSADQGCGSDRSRE